MTNEFSVKSKCLGDFHSRIIIDIPNLLVENKGNKIRK